MIFYFSDKSMQMESSICNDSQFEHTLPFFLLQQFYINRINLKFEFTAY